MSAVRVVIVDDEKPARDRIRRLLRDHPDFEIVGEASDAVSAVTVIDRERPDLCFLDVQMPAGDGFDVLTRVRHVPRVIFTTAYDRYAVRAFEVNSIDYLLKPFSSSRFAAAVDRARDELAQRSSAVTGADLLRFLEKMRDGAVARATDETAPAAARMAESVPRIPARRGAKILLLDPQEVLWFEADGELVFARTEEGRALVERTLSELEQALSAMFFRAHRAYLVNLSKVGEIRPGELGTHRLVLRDGARSEVPLSRRQARKLREKIPW